MGLLLRTGLKQHKYYVYYDGDTVFARMDDLECVVLKTFEDGKDGYGNDVSAAQRAHDFVQTIVNPENLPHTHPKFGNKGFNHSEFQSRISDNCKVAVLTAYKAAGKLPAEAA